MEETTKSWQQWQADLSLRKQASAQAKQASAMDAEDPTEKGQVEAKPNGDAAHRSNINLPDNPTRNTVQTKDGIHGLCATGPYSVGEGEYPTAIDGDAKDEAYKTPATPLDKIAGNLARSAEQFTIPADVAQDSDIMRKMAYIGQLAMADERGQALVDDIITKQAGRAEAQAILTEAYNTLQKESAANNMINNMYNPLIKAAADELSVGELISNAPEASKRLAAQYLLDNLPLMSEDLANNPSEFKLNIDSNAINQGIADAAATIASQRKTLDDAIPGQIGTLATKQIVDNFNAGAPIPFMPGSDVKRDEVITENDAPGAAPDPGMFAQILKWIQENPGLAASIGAGTAGLGVGGVALHNYIKNRKKKQEKKASFMKAAAACAQSHAAWLGTFGTPFEKLAYQQGAVDGEMMANAAEDPAVQQAMGGDAIPADTTQVSDEEVMAAIQALYESGQVTEEQVAAFLQQIQGDQMPAYTAADLAMMLQQDVQSGTLDPAAADQIANEITAMVQSGQMPAGEMPQADPAAQQGMEVQASVNRTAALYNSML